MPMVRKEANERLEQQNRILRESLAGCAWPDCGHGGDTARLGELRVMSEAMAEDGGLWFIPVTITEDYLQRALRKLCAAVEQAADVAGGQ